MTGCRTGGSDSWENDSDVSTPATLRTSGGLADCEGVDVNIVHDSESAVTTSPELLHAERMSRVDGCGVCVSNYVLPSIVRDAPEGGFVAYYTCTDCGHDWITSWGDR